MSRHPQWIDDIATSDAEFRGHCFIEGALLPSSSPHGVIRQPIPFGHVALTRAASACIPSVSHFEVRHKYEGFSGTNLCGSLLLLQLLGQLKNLTFFGRVPLADWGRQQQLLPCQHRNLSSGFSAQPVPFSTVAYRQLSARASSDSKRTPKHKSNAACSSTRTGTP